MRTWVLAVALGVVACKGGKKREADKPEAEAKAKASRAFVAPKVDVATVLAKEEPAQPPYLLFVDEKGQLKIAAAATWADLDANKIRIAKKAAPFEALDSIDRFTRENFAFGRMGEMAVESISSFDDFSSVDIDLAALEEVSAKHDLDQDDPPPPEEADMPDDGADERGGTGTAIALEEGKMGKKDSDRAEGQYKMQKNQVDPQLARQLAIEQARAAGILGGGNGGGGQLGEPYRPSADGSPVRVAQVAGAVAEDGKLSRPRLMVLVPPAMKATKLVEIVSRTGAAIAVTHGNKLRPLRLDFDERGSAVANDWLEARVSANGIVVEAVPDKPLEVADVKGLATAIEEARQARGSAADAPVDVLVDAEIDAQRLVDVLVALDIAGVRTIGIGTMPAEELARRGKRIPRTLIGQPNAQGDLDKAEIRRVVKSSLEKISACYTKALLDNPALAGTVSTQFFIAPSGKVASATASGVDPAVAECVAGVVKALEFPKPKGGGGVQVNYPFTFRP
jgi:hypothetical protein